MTQGLVEAAPRISIHTLETPSACTHEVAVPPNCTFTGFFFCFGTCIFSTWDFKHIIVQSFCKNDFGYQRVFRLKLWIFSKVDIILQLGLKVDKFYENTNIITNQNVLKKQSYSLIRNVLMFVCLKYLWRNMNLSFLLLGLHFFLWRIPCFNEHTLSIHIFCHWT